ncbi:MAG: hypothetical protein V1783_06910, partial [Bacteroidota bacterium]
SQAGSQEIIVDCQKLFLVKHVVSFQNQTNKSREEKIDLKCGVWRMVTLYFLKKSQSFAKLKL